MLPVREKVEHVALRIKFTKTGALQYISHLDLHRTFSRLLVRLGVPIWYSEGFTPHPRLVFATPLSVGAESLCEYVDVYVNFYLFISHITYTLVKATFWDLK